MMRFVALSLLAASAMGNEVLTGEAMLRQLQLPSTDFNITLAGQVINMDSAKNDCPAQYTPVVTCIANNCLDFAEKCPSIDEPTGDLLGDDAVAVGNGTTVEDLVPTCEEIEEEYCAAVAGTPGAEECCLVDCTNELVDLVVCVLKEATGADRSDCKVPECPGVEVNPDETTAPVSAPAEKATSGATMTGAAAAAMSAFALLA